MNETEMPDTMNVTDYLDLQKRGNKYRAKRTWSELCQRTFDSKHEAKRGEELHLLAEGGVITNLEYQVKYVLSTQPKVTITVDFMYRNAQTGAWIWEDAKGVLTREFRVKRIWLQQQQGIEVRLV